MAESNNKTHVTETPDVSYIKNVDVTHETSDVHIGGIAKFVVGLSLLTIAVFLLTWGLFRAFEAKTKEPPRSPMALSGKDRLPLEPRLQGAPGFGEQLGKTATNEEKTLGVTETGSPKAPTWEIDELHKQWSDVLEHGPVDKDGKRYGLPIEKAKEEILKQGLPARGQKADSRKQ